MTLRDGADDPRASAPVAATLSTEPRWQPLRLDVLVAGIRRRWPLVVGLPAAVVVASLALHRPPPAMLQAQLSFAIDIPASALVEGSDEGTAAKIGEALIDDMSRIIRGDRFAAAVQARLDGIDVVAGESAGSLSADDRHRVADVTVTRAVADEPGVRAEATDELLAIARAVVAELEDNGGTWFARLGADDIALTIIDGPRVIALEPSLRTRLELPLRGLLALLIALGIAGALHAADPRLHGARDVEEVLGLPVIGRVPGRDGLRGRA